MVTIDHFPRITMAEQAPTPDTRTRRLRFSLTRHVRANFLAGILVTAPVAITLYAVWAVVSWFDQEVVPLIPTRYSPETYLAFPLPGLGLLIAVIALYLIGALTAGLFGRYIMGIGERMLARVPVVRGIYGATKQIAETVLAKQSNAFREVALIEYPRKGTWTMGFITGRPTVQIVESTAEDVVSVFVPTTPVPSAGFLLFVPRSEIVVLDMTVEEGLKMVVSLGIVTPPERLTPNGESEPQRLARTGTGEP
jgi:uncharacterized membrane protein